MVRFCGYEKLKFVLPVSIFAICWINKGVRNACTFAVFSKYMKALPFGFSTRIFFALQLCTSHSRFEFKTCKQTAAETIYPLLLLFSVQNYCPLSC